jgi:hypothetical protein
MNRVIPLLIMVAIAAFTDISTPSTRTTQN